MTFLDENGTTPTEGELAFERVMGDRASAALEAMRVQSPVLASWVTEFIFGTVYRQGSLDFRQQQIITITALTALGGCEPQLELHIAGAINVGLSPEEVIAVILHAAPYAGFPRALNAMAAANRVLDD